MVFNLSNNTGDLPKISDIIDPSGGFPFNFFQVFTEVWVWFLGGWFFAGLFGFIACALYMKSQNVLYPVVFLVLMCALFGGVLRATPIGSIPVATEFVNIVGIVAGFVVGFLLYNLYRESK